MDIYLLADGLTGDTIGYVTSQEKAEQLAFRYLDEYPEPYWEGPIKLIENE